MEGSSDYDGEGLPEDPRKAILLKLTILATSHPDHAELLNKVIELIKDFDIENVDITNPSGRDQVKATVYMAMKKFNKEQILTCIQEAKYFFPLKNDVSLLIHFATVVGLNLALALRRGSSEN